nr:antibiotic resistance ABC transporter efflux protein [Mycobacterium marinum]
MGPRAYTATTTRIPRQLAADHRSVAMALPVLTAPLRRLDLLAGLPQLLLAGIIVPRAVMPTWLEWVSNAMPASCALEALQQVGAHPELTYIALRDIVVVVVFAVASLCLAAATLRRRMS